MNVLVPLTISDAMLISSTIAEPAADETVWVSGGTYAVGDQRIRTTTHRIYECGKAHSGVSKLPEDDLDNWFDAGPTAKWAAFDTEVSTQSRIATPLTYVLQPGFFNAIAFYGLDGADISVTVKDGPGGATVFSYSGSLQEPPPDWYEWLFSTIRPLSKLVLRDIVPYPDAELTITITAAGGGEVGAGMIAIGDMRPLMGDAPWGGPEYGATAEPVDFSYIKTEFDGTTSIKKRRNATDIRVRVVMPREFADYALSVVQEVLSLPAGWIATDVTGFGGLNTFGLGSGSLSYDSFGRAVFAIYVKGLV
jgi:hypothetical protein